MEGSSSEIVASGLLLFILRDGKCQKLPLARCRFVLTPVVALLHLPHTACERFSHVSTLIHFPRALSIQLPFCSG